MRASRRKGICNRSLGVRSVKDSSWHEISRFESNDLVKIWYEKTHGKSPPADKISQINAFFKQGREYFNNAAGADMSVKPLLLYYGVLSLSRGTVLLLDISKKEESLKKKHGLEVVDWGHTLSGGIKNVLELKIKATDGTFRELVDVCPNIQNEQCFYFPTKTKVVVDHDLGPIKFASDGGLLSLDDLLSRLMQTASDYQGITERKSKWFPVVVTVHSTETHFALISPHVLPELLELVDEKSVFVQQTLKTWPNIEIETIPQVSLVFKHETEKAHQRKFPVFHYAEGHQTMTGILDFPNKDKLSEFFKLYLVSYALGMLARYYPSKWMALLLNAPGDFAQPLLVKAIQAIESDFPRELSRQVRQHPTTLS